MSLNNFPADETINTYLLEEKLVKSMKKLLFMYLDRYITLYSGKYAHT